MNRKPPSARRATKLRRVSAAVVLAMAAILSLAACSPKADTDAATPAAANDEVTLTPAQRAHISLFTVAASQFQRTTKSSGVVDFDNDQATSVLAPFSGPVARLLVSAGDRVTKGQPLAIVDSPDFATAVSAYRKALAAARNTRRLADMDKDLLQHNGVSQREATQAETDALSAEADRDAALQSLVSLGVDPQSIRALQQGRPLARVEGVIRSPIAGTVAEKLITPGELLQAGTTPCFTVADLSKVWVLAQISDVDVGQVQLGDPAEVLSDATPAGFAGTVTNVSAEVSTDTRAVIARVVVENPGDLLKKQMYVRVLLHSRAQSHGLLVPVSAILRDDENLPLVYVAQADGGFARRAVTLGTRAGDQYDIAAGLKAGERVVVEGGVFLQFMQSQ
jgi:cobalt-zinc-cadmium efflux system membrane fusion protein